MEPSFSDSEYRNQKFFGNFSIPWKLLRRWEVAPCRTHSGCFPKFSLNFVEGAGEVDGEILETLWSPLDEVAD